jgi:hypothetical protein
VLQCLCLGIVAGLLRPRLFPFGKLSKLKSAAQLRFKIGIGNHAYYYIRGYINPRSINS